MKKALLAGLVIGCVFPVVAAQTDQGELGPPGQSRALIYSVKGQDLFQAYCASCHGARGKGGGPVASALKTKPPDLTVLAKKNSGQFPTVRVRNLIAGDEVLAHGSREMPLWGPIFHQIEEDQDFGNVRMENLVRYLKSIQATTASSPLSGADLYKKDCAVCHGDDLRGGGSVPSPYRVPPDLTTLARRHGGTFPRSYVSRILRNGIAMPAHGPAQMPTWGADFRLGEKLDDTEIRSRIAALTGYLESRQGK